MAKPGPKRTPTRLLKIRGSWLAGQRDVEPKPVGSVPVVPAWFDDIQTEGWLWATEELRGMNMLHRADQASLMALAINYAVVVRAGQLLRSATTVDGFDSTSGIFNAFNKADASLRRWCSELGLTPSGRAGLAVNSEDLPKGVDRFVLRKAAGASSD